MKKHILFVGHSDCHIMPLCMMMFRAMCYKKGWHDIGVRSGGFWNISRVHPHLVTVAGEVGLDLTRYQPHRISESDLMWADWIIPQDEMIRRGLLTQKKLVDNKMLKPMKLKDPTGGTVDYFRDCRERASHICGNLFRKLNAEVKENRAMQKELILRPITSADIPAVVALETECFTHPWTADNVLGELQKEGCYFVGAFFDECMIGYGSLSLVWGEGYINNIAVKAKYRSCGIGSRILKALIAHCELEKAESLSLEVRSRNTTAMRMYQKYGFTQVGLRRNFYRDPTDDALIFTRWFQNQQQ